MINQQLLNPGSIVVIGGSNNVHKPGGAIVRNIKNGGFGGDLRIVNPKEDEVQGIKAYHDVKDIPQTEMAILVVAAKFCPDYVDYLCKEKGARAFVIISAGFGEETKAGAELEQRILDTCEQYGAALIGPNCIGLMNRNHHSVFTLPIPNLNPKGVDFISGSGATAVFILESAVIKGLQFNSVWSIGNGKQIGIEDVLQYMDDNFNPETDSKVKLLYIENISNPDKLLFHASRLIHKGCRIAAIKAGSSESGSRAASSHTGAIASSDSAVEALFRKAGIVRCFSREELTTVGCIFTLPELKGKNFAIVTHAGGPGVMLTDALSKGGLNVPTLDGKIAEHWDNIAAKAEPNPSGHTQIDNVAPVKDIEKTEANRELVKNFLYDVMQGNNPQKTADYFDGDKYIQHNTGIADGLSGLGAALAALAEAGIQMIYTIVHQVLAQGDYVLAVSEGTFGGAPTSYYDLWRVENGKIAEHWDVMETIAAPETWQNHNGKF